MLMMVVKLNVLSVEGWRREASGCGCLMKMNKINPNNFIVIKGDLFTYTDSLMKTAHFIGSHELCITFKNIIKLETTVEADGQTNHWIVVRASSHQLTLAKNRDSTIFRIDENAYNEIKAMLVDVDFDIPVIETKDEIREIVKEEIVKGKNNTAISSLEV